MSTTEKQQAVEAIKAVLKSRVFFIFLAGIQVAVIKIFTTGLSTTSGPLAIIIVILSLFLTFCYWLYIRRPIEKINSTGLKIVKVLQIINDELLITIILYQNGTVNVFSVVFFYIIIMSGSILYRERGIIASAIAASAIFTSLVMLEYYGLFLFLSHPDVVRAVTLKGDANKAIYQVLAFNVYCLATAIYAGYLAGLNKKREDELEAQRDELNFALVKSNKLRLEADKARRQEAVARKQEEIEKNEVEAVIRNLTAGLIMLDPKRKAILVNNQAEKMLGINRKNLFNKKLTEIGNDNLTKLDQLLSSAGGQQLEKKPLTFIGPPERYFEISTAAVLDPKQRPLGQIIVLNDVTREKELDKTKSEFITITAHQLRTPLSGLKWALSLILDQDLGPINSKQKKVLQQGFASNEKMIDLISDLLNLTSLEEGRFAYNFSQASLADLVSTVINDFQTYSKIKRVKIDFFKPRGDNFEATIDKDKITLVIQNLIENAINYSPANSTVTITLERDNHNLVFAVKDLGLGISDKEKPRLFTKFFRGETALKMETEGNGLGLYLAKNIITSHKGKIWYESQLGQGSTFYFKLPAGG